ncbi:cyclin-I [Cynoglossus semilaevis]|uniref:Cyclin-I n=2 Tax=Cynoglossus semilaevis TaxID=244447 RepID=A0A3P8UGN1_CYNSE|nr:cyclin-I [Cynoglossus semilaevis]
MKWAEPWVNSQRLSFLLEKTASREAKMWKIYVPKKPSSQDTDISPAQRDEAVRWLTELHSRLQLYPETLVLAVSILDRFLASIRARPKYLRCIAISCFFLAAKTCEEDECVPSLKELAASSSCGCSPSEILRMERIVLDKLSWSLLTATALDFLHIFHATVSSCRSGFLDAVLGINRSQHLALITQRLYHCLADHTLIQLRGSMLALALITLELETCCPDWLALTTNLLKRTQINSSELIRSRELVARSLSTHRVSLPPNTVYIYQPPKEQQQEEDEVKEMKEENKATAITCSQGTISSSISFTSSSSSAATQQIPAGAEEMEEVSPAPPGSSSLSSCQDSTIPPLLSPSNNDLHHQNHLQKVTLRCKASAKRKVEDMEVDDFYDGIKRLYNEEVTTVSVQEGATPATGGGALNSCRKSSSPCPPLQPVTAS